MKNKKNLPVLLVIAGIIVFIGVAFLSYSSVKAAFKAQTSAALKLAESDYELEKNEMKEAGTNRTAEEEDKKKAETSSKEEKDEPEKEEEKKEADRNTGKKTVDASSFLSKNGKRIDYSVQYFKPGKRTSSLKWEDKVFSKIENPGNPKEALINTFPFFRRALKTSDDKNLEFEVYCYPETGKPARLSAIENCGDYYEITNYYFDEDEMLNYASSCRQTVIMPIALNSSEITSRYYFSNDVMVRFIYSDGQEAKSYRSSDMSKYSSGTREQYDYIENETINKAYISYYSFLNTDEIVKVSGYVMDEFNQPVSRAVMRISSEDGQNLKKIKTNGDGYYSFSVDASDEAYTISAEKDDMTAQQVYNLRVIKGSGHYFVDTIYMCYYENRTDTYDVHLIVRDAISNSKVIDNAELKLRTGVNNTDGTVFASGTLDSAGTMNIPLSSGMYTAQVDKEGYETSYFNVTVRQDHQSVIGYAVPEIEEGSYLAYVYWETTPFDLDCRMFGEYGATILRSPVDSIGSVMTECFAMEKPGNEPYKLYVSDYISCTAGNYMSYNMSVSGAYVKVYSSEGLIASLSVPAAHAGVIWDALTIRDGVVYPDNRYYYTPGTDLYWTSK